MGKTGRREVDLAARVRLLKAVVFGGGWGGALGFIAGVLLGYPILGALLGAVGISFGSWLVAERLGGAAHVIYAPTGRSTKPTRDYSHAEAFAVQGRYDDAIAIYQQAIAQVPSDPDPYLRIARLLTDKVNDHERAADWLERALEETELRGRWEVILVRELNELLRDRIGEPTRAAPLLARVAERYEGSPDGEWAQDELAHVMRLIDEDLQ